MVRYFALLISMAAFPSMALAVFDIQVFGGGGMGQAEFQNASGDNQKLDFQGTNLGAAVHLNPIETIPVSIGASYLQESPRIMGPAGGSYASFSGAQASLELMVWIPLNSYAIYGKFGEIIQGSYRAVKTASIGEAETDSPISDMSYQGKYAGLGLGAALTPGLGIFCELRAKFSGKLIESQRSLLSDGGHGSRARTIGSLSASSMFAGIELGI